MSSRTDLTEDDDNDGNNDDMGGNLTSIVQSLPSVNLDDTLQNLLGEASFLRYRGTVLDGLAQKALQLLLQTQGLTAVTDANKESCELAAGVLDSHMLLDRTASECIHLLLPPPHAGLATVVGGKPHNNSLFGILHQCKTPVGDPAQCGPGCDNRWSIWNHCSCGRTQSPRWWTTTLVGIVSAMKVWPVCRDWTWTSSLSSCFPSKMEPWAARHPPSSVCTSCVHASNAAPAASSGSLQRNGTESGFRACSSETAVMALSRSCKKWNAVKHSWRLFLI